VLVGVPRERVRRRRVEVEVLLLHVLAVVTLAAGEAEEALLQDRVLAVPHRDREAEQLVAIADAGDAVLVPAVHARARLVVREVVPRGAVGAVVLAHRAPGALGEVGPPALPVRLAIASLGEPSFFVGHAAEYAPRATRVTRARTSSTVSAAGSATTVASAPNRARQGSS